MRKLGSILKIESGEGELIAANFLQAFFVGTARLFTLTAGYSLFVKEYGAEKLPYVYVATALVVPLAGVALMKLERRVGFMNKLLWVAGFLILSQVLFRISIGLEGFQWLVVALLIWKDLEWALTNILLWNMANRLFTVRQSKRLFGMVAGGEIAATTLGGFSIPLLVVHFDIGTPNLLIFSVVAHLAAFLNLFAMKWRFSGRLNLPWKDKVLGEDPADPDISLKDLLKHRYIRSILGLLALSYVIFYLIDYAFYSEVEGRFNDPAEVAALIAKVYAVLGVGSFLVSTFVTGRLLGRFGLLAGLVATPLLLGPLAIAVVIVGQFNDVAGFLFGLFVAKKIMEELLGNTIFSPAYYTLFQSLEPAAQAKAQDVGDVFVGQIAGGITGVILLAAAGLGVVEISVIILFVLGGWAILGDRVNRGYITSLKDALTRRGLRGVDLSLRDHSTVEVLLEGVRSAAPQKAIYCLDLMRQLDYPDLDQLLLELLFHESPRVRCAAASALEDLGEPEVSDSLEERLAKETDREVVSRILRALGSAGEGEVVETLESYLDEGEEGIRMSALVSLIRYGGIEGAIRGGTRLMQLQQSGDPEERRFAARALGEIGIRAFYRGLVPLLGDADSETRKEALKAAGELGNPRLWPHVVENLEDRRFRQFASGALTKGGSGALPALAAVVEDEARNPGVRVAAGEIIARIPKERSAEILLGLLPSSLPAIRGVALGGLRSLRFRANRDFLERFDTLLKRELRVAATLAVSQGVFARETESELMLAAIDHDLRETRDRILLILSLCDPELPLSDVRAGLDSESPDRRAFALEIIERGLRPSDKPIVLTLFESTDLLGWNLGLPSDLRAEVPDPKSLLDAVVRGHAGEFSNWTRAVSLDLADRKRLPDLESVLNQLESSSQHLHRETASHLLQRRAGGETGSLSLIGKVEVLRRIGAFKNVPDQWLGEVAQDARCHQMSAGETLLKKGEIESSLHIVVSGSVNVHGRGNSSNTLGPGRAIGEFSVFDPEPRATSVTCLEPTVTLEFGAETIHTFVMNHSHACFPIVIALCRGLRKELSRHSVQVFAPTKAFERESGAAEEPPIRMPDSDVLDLTILEKVIVLKTSEIFRGVSDELLAELCGYTSMVTLNKGETLFEKGDLGTTTYVVVNGTLQICDGDQVMTKLDPGAVIGEMAALAPEERSATVRSATSSRLLSLSRDGLLEVMRAQPSVVEALMQMLVRRMRSVLAG